MSEIFRPSVSRDTLTTWFDFVQAENLVAASLSNLGASNHQWMHFIVAYGSWNSRFASAVSALSSFIGEQKNLFKDPSVPAIVADRSNYIASFVLAAARAEYGIHIQLPSGTPRFLGHATIIATAQLFGIDLNTLTEPQWLHSTNKSILAGYTGINTLDTANITANPLPGELLHRIFQGLGYHLGAELFSLQEFSVIDSYLRGKKPDLFHHLLNYPTRFAGVQHRGYAWHGVQNGTPHVKGPEDKHVAHALQGVNEALGFIPAHLRDECMLALRQGFLRLAHDHEHFFQRVGQVTE